MTPPLKIKARVSIIGTMLTFFFCLTLLGSNALAEDKPVYKAVPPKPMVSCDSKTETAFVFETIPGWKWNDEYPAKIKLSPSEGLEISPGAFSKSAGNIKVNKQIVSMPFQLGLSEAVCKKKGAKKTSKVTVVASFSICNDETCRVFRNKSFEFDVQSR